MPKFYKKNVACTVCEGMGETYYEGDWSKCGACGGKYSTVKGRRQLKRLKKIYGADS